MCYKVLIKQQHKRHARPRPPPRPATPAEAMPTSILLDSYLAAVLRRSAMALPPCDALRLPGVDSDPVEGGSCPLACLHSHLHYV